MKHFRPSLLITSIASLLMSTSIHAASFQLYELGTPIIGTAGVGQAAVASDASISYYNPAGMAQLQDSQFMLGSQLLLPYNYFSKSHRTTILGDSGGGNAGTLTPGVDMYYIHSISPRLKFGVSLTSPYGGWLTYTNGWVGRFVVQEVQFYTLDLTPAFAYQINKWLAVGGGVTMEYINLHETVAIPIMPLVDGQITIKVDNTNSGLNLGALLTPTPTTKVGVVYRSLITHELRGKTTFLRIPFTPSTSTKMVMPQNVILSAAQNLTNQFTLLGELGWANWSTMHNTILKIARFTSTTPRNWHDTYRIGLGGQFKVNPTLLLQAGASYDSSPTNASHRLPDLPIDRQVRIGAGLIYNVIKAVQLGFSYEYLNLGNANINNFSSDGALVGSYARNYVNVFQASINVGF